MSEDCIFCKVIKGEMNSYNVYEDGVVIAILDLNPVAEGHVLVMPKNHYENIFDVPEDVLERIAVVCKKIGNLLREKLGASGVNVLNASGKDAQQSVGHLHYHVVPRNFEDGLDLWFHGKGENDFSVEDVHERLK